MVVAHAPIFCAFAGSSTEQSGVAAVGPGCRPALKPRKRVFPLAGGHP